MKDPVKIGTAVIEKSQIAAVMPTKESTGATRKLLVFLLSGQTITIPASETDKEILTKVT